MTMQELKNRRLKLYLECEEKILVNQSYKIGDREYTRADLEDVRKVISAHIDDGAVLDEAETGLKLSRTKRVIFIE